MNKWKIAFGLCLTVLILVTGLAAYFGIDQGVTLTYQKEGYTKTVHDLDQIIQLLNNTDLSKKQLQQSLKDHALYEYMDFTTDTIPLERVLLIFDNNKLKMIRKQW